MLRPAVAPSISNDLRSLLEASPNAIVAVDASGSIAYANPKVQDTFGYAPDEVVGRSVDTLVPADLAGTHAQHRASFMAHPSARPMGIGLDLAGRRRDGTRVPVEISLVPLDTPNGRLVFATIVDITARTSLEAQLRQAQKMESIGRLAGGIAHDFNNMLFAIRSYADLLAEDLDAPTLPDRAAMRSTIEGIDRAADQAAQLTAQLLAFSRHQLVQPSVIDLREAIVRIEPMLRRMIGEDVRLGIVPRNGPTNVRVDPTQLDQVLVNLVVNARDAMPDGGAVTIESRIAVVGSGDGQERPEVPPGEYGVLVVTDTGIGMDADTRQRIFEPFFTTKPVGKGTGLGLAMVYGAVTQSGGSITVDSEVGAGTSFRLFFPLVNDAPTTEAAGTDAERVATPRRVLLVEDEPHVREAARMVLERAGFEVESTGDPREALAMIERTEVPLDVLVTDIVMPDLSGRELADRALAARDRLGIVLLSGYTTETADVADLVGRGARFASKPIAARDLVSLVSAAAAETRD